MNWITRKQQEYTFLPRTAVLSWSDRLLILLLMGDAGLMLLHFLLLLSPFEVNNRFYLDFDGGLGEWFQYLKYAGMVGLLAVTLRRQHRQPLYLFWLAVFVYLLLDDSLRLHELGGGWLVKTASLPPLLQLRPQDLGELAISGFAALFFLTMLVVAYQRSGFPARHFCQWLLLLFVGLAFFGVGADILQSMTFGFLRPYPLLGELLIIVEEGGEMIVVSLMVWLTYREAERVCVWTPTEVGLWVRSAAVAVALWGVVTAVLVFIQWGTTALVGNDGYYHAKMGLLLRQGGLAAAHPQLPLTILNETDFYNHHLLYHVYLALFTRIDPVLDGGLALTRHVKIAAVLLASLPFLAVWWLLRGQAVRWAALWTILLLGLSEPFLYRLSMPRAQSASLLVLVLALHWLLQGKHRHLLPLGFIYVWLYDAFPLLLLLGGIYFTAVFITERRFLWSALLYPAAGITVGLIINPYFPQNLAFISHHLLAKLGDSAAVPVGSEWYPYDTWMLLQNSGLALALCLVTLLLLNRRGQRLDARLLTLCLVTAVFALMLFRARRFIEYFPAFVLIFAACGLSPIIENKVGKWYSQQKWLLAGCIVLLIVSILYTVRAARITVADSLPADQYAAAALWLQTYSEPDSMIFQTDWDDFTRLFFYNSDARYTVGLDPTFMARSDPDLYANWVQLTRGEVTRPAGMIYQQFNAAYVFSSLEQDAFLQQAAGDPGLHEIYRDAYAVIFSVEAFHSGE